MEIRRKDALDYHRQGRKGKIELTPTKPCRTQWDLSLAYTPGVAEPCKEIHKDHDLSFEYTARGNLVAVVSNGTAVLGLGNIGAHASKPVMEGKAVLFKRFADIDVFDLEVGSENPDDVIKFCQLLEPTCGGINLEDIKAPECFYVEEMLRKDPVDPGLSRRPARDGHYLRRGAAERVGVGGQENRRSARGVQRRGRGGLGFRPALCAPGRAQGKHHHVRHLRRDLRGPRRGHESLQLALRRQNFEAPPCRSAGRRGRVRGAFRGQLRDRRKCSSPWRTRPIIFALANPNPEIGYEQAKAARPDAIVATGRSDFPNQVNNVLGFPGIFRGALDVRARAINEEMKVAATHALSDLAKEDVPDSVLRAYGLARLQFGPEYINPKPFDPRALIWVSAAVAEAAMRTGVAQVQINLDTYRDELARRLARTYGVMQNVRQRAKAAPKRIVFSEGEHDKVLRASHQIIEESIAYPILLGRPVIVGNRLKELGFENMCPKVIDPTHSPHFEAYVQEFYRLRRRGGVTLGTAREQMLNPNFFGAMMVHMGDADGFVAGVSQNYPETIRPALQIVKTRPGVHRVAAVFVIVTKKDVYFFADTHVNIDPTAEDLAEIAVLAAEVAHDFGVEPRVAMLSFSNFGSNHHPKSEKMRRAVELALEINPEMMIDGEMMADTALVPELIEEEYPFSNLKGGATVLVFPDLAAANIAYKMMMRIGGAESLGPILMGLSKSVHVLQRGATVEEIVNMAAIAVVDAQKHSVQLQVVPRAPAA